eukprot:360301-Chlamydomonas_euryale.AAC.8
MCLCLCPCSPTRLCTKEQLASHAVDEPCACAGNDEPVSVCACACMQEEDTTPVHTSLAATDPAAAGPADRPLDCMKATRTSGAAAEAVAGRQMATDAAAAARQDASTAMPPPAARHARAVRCSTPHPQPPQGRGWLR